jgi:hypothetical protein
MAVDNPTGFNASILGKIKDIERRLDELSAAPLGKVKFDTAFNSPVLNPIITPTPSVMTTTVTVPALATSCAFSAFASGAGINTTGATGWMAVQVEVIYGTYDNYTFASQSNILAGTEGNLVTPMVDKFTFPTGGGTLTLKASIWNGAGSWTTTSINAIFAEGLFVFQY